MKAVLFKSDTRFSEFKKILDESNIRTFVLDFSDDDWITFDYSVIDFIIYYPSFEFCSNNPCSLYKVKDNLSFIHDNYPDLIIYPDPGLYKYYSDKYTQHLFFKKHNIAYPKTFSLYKESNLDQLVEVLEFPIIIKNRYGAGGDYVFKIENIDELSKFLNLSIYNLFNFDSLKYFIKMLSKRSFYYWLVKRKMMQYPFLSYPLLVQEYIYHERDLKLVVINNKIIEGHWRNQTNKQMWKMNIDGGGIGEWSFIPEEAINLAEETAKLLNAKWINFDLILHDGHFYISEFSPVWHHYKYKEKDSFIYKDDYNIDIPLDYSLNLEKVIVDSMQHNN